MNKNVQQKLSDREKQVAILVAKGKRSNEIAKILSITSATVESHRKHICKKLGIRNTPELVLLMARGKVSFNAGKRLLETAAEKKKYLELKRKYTALYKSHQLLQAQYDELTKEKE